MKPPSEEFKREVEKVEAMVPESRARALTVGLYSDGSELMPTQHGHELVPIRTERYCLLFPGSDVALIIPSIIPSMLEGLMSLQVKRLGSLI